MSSGFQICRLYGDSATGLLFLVANTKIICHDDDKNDAHECVKPAYTPKHPKQNRQEYLSLIVKRVRCHQHRRAQYSSENQQTERLFGNRLIGHE